MKCAIPSVAPGGLDAEVSPHFGHCDLFTLVEIDGNHAQQVDTLANVPHEQGGCMAPIMLLKQAGVEAIVAGGMGMRPLLGFQQAGIEVYFSENTTKVEEAVTLLTTGRARKFGPAQVCGGGGDGPGRCEAH